MSAVDALLSHPACRAAAWALVHFLWQGTVVSLLLAAALALTPRRLARIRYAVAGSGLAAMLALPVVTAIWITGRKGVIATEGIVAAPAVGAGTGVDSMGHGLVAGVAGMAMGLTRSLPDGWLNLAVAVWLAGVLVLSARNLGSWLGARDLTRRGTFTVPQTWETRMLDLARRMGVARRVRLLGSHRVSVPAVVGWIRPAVLVPASAITGLSPSDLEALLAHELAHIRRHDYLINLVQTLAETVLFYHPGVWWVSRQMRLERENACDDLAAACCGDPRRVAGALARMELLRSPSPAPALGADGGSLLARMARLVGGSSAREKSDRRLPGTVVLLAALALGAVLFAVRPGPGTSSAAFMPPKASNFAPSDSWSVSTGGNRTSDRGTWELEYRDGHVRLEVRVGKSRWGQSGDLKDYGLTRETVEKALAEDPIRFRFPREAGVFDFEGKADSRSGGVRAHGDFTFTPDPEYATKMHALGYDSGDVKDRQMELAAHDVNTGFVRELGSLGYEHLPFDRLVEFRIHGIDPDYVRGMAQAGFPNLDPARVVEFRIHGIDPEYVRGLAASGYRDLPAERVVEFRIHGIDPDYVKGMAEAGYADLPAERLVEFRIHGIDPEYVRGLAKAGYPSLPAERAVEFKIHGIDPSYVSGLASVGYANLPPEKVVEMKIHGVTADSIRRLQERGLKDLTPDEIIEIHIRGVDAVLRDRGSR